MQRLTRAVIAAVVLAFCSLVGVTPAAAAESGGTLVSTPYSFPISYQCHADGTISVTATRVLSGPPESWQFVQGAGTIVPSAAGGGSFAFSGGIFDIGFTFSGTYADSGAWLSVVHTETDYTIVVTNPGVEGAFVDLPDCRAKPGQSSKPNHGQYVAELVPSGVTGPALATIAKDGSLIGRYTP
jgi:uncharacterized membrane protein